MMISLHEAFEIADKAHEGQTDKAGRPYIEHVVRVARSLIAPHHQEIALLHDVMGYSDMGEDDLINAGLGPTTLATLKLLTRKKEQSYSEYIDGLLSRLDTCIVKLADLRDNMDLLRLPEITHKDLNRLKKYHKAYFKLIGATKKHFEEDDELRIKPELLIPAEVLNLIIS